MALKDFADLGKAAIEVVRDFSALAKARAENKGMVDDKPLVEKAAENPKSLMFDPYAIIDQLGYKDKPSNMTYGTLKAIYWKLPIVQAIHVLRMNQVASFCRPQKDKYSIGFKVKLRDSEREPTKEEIKWVQKMSNMIMSTGATDNPKGRDDFEDFVKKIVKDSLTYDQWCYEVVPNRKGLPAEWYATDASTIRIADNGKTFNDEDDTKAIRYVQIYDGMIINEYTQDEMTFNVRNPNTDIRLQGYGTSELEMLVTTITGLLNAHDYNAKFFTQGNPMKGLLNFKGAVPGRQLEDFKRQWYSLLSSVENAWKTPIVNSGEQDIQYINLQATHRDMEFNAWMDFLIKEACAVYAMDPAEINFVYGNTGQKASLVESSNSEKITESKERGLRPLLRNVAKSFNKNIIQPINPDFELEFVGLDSDTRNTVVDRNTKRVKSFITVDELRAEEDKPPLPNGQGEVILDPTFLQHMQGIQAQAQAEEGGEEGEDNEEGGGQDIKQLLSQFGNDDNDEQEEEDTEKSMTWNITLN